MIYLLLLFLEICLLFIFSRIITKNLSRFLSIHALSFLFFPGVVIHELSHILVAAIMFVRVGEVEFKPKIENGGLKLGSAAIAKTDPIRRAIIGFAPVLIGIFIIIGLVYFQSPFSSFWGSIETPESGFWSHFVRQNDSIGVKILLSAITFYLLFAISNTMFSSKKDMEGTLEIIIVLFIISTALYFVGFRFPPYLANILFSEEAVGLFQKSSIFLMAPIMIDLFILGAIKTIYLKKTI